MTPTPPDPETMKVIWIVIAIFVALVPILGGFIVVIWRLMVWGHDQVRAIHKEERESADGRRFFREVAQEAVSATLAPLTTSIADLEHRQRKHGERIGALENDVSALKARVQASRSSDLSGRIGGE